MTTRFSYDAVPYPSYTFAQTHPDRLAVMARFNGMRPAAPEDSRVLELGCGDGSNLLSFAYALPSGRFVGIDLSEVHIADARAAADELNLSNVEFIHGDVAEFGRAGYGEFDFIVAHGLYSWVPGPVRQEILRIYSECLRPHGVGYISYNVYPGCRLREIAWDFMRYSVADIGDPLEKARRAKAAVNILAESMEADSLVQMLMRLEAEAVNERSDENVFHDDLSEFNRPFYFHEFLADLQSAGLQFLSEVDPFASNSADLCEPARRMLDAVGSDIAHREQLTDFVRLRRFRSSLVCRSEIDLSREPSPEIVSSFYISSNLECETSEPDLASDTPVKFTGHKGASLEVNHPLTKASLAYLRSIWAQSASFDEIVAGSKKLIGGLEGDESSHTERLREFLLQLFGAGLVKFHTFAPQMASFPGEYPEASAFARRQAARGSTSVTTLTGMNLEPENDLIRAMLLLLDGTRDRAGVCNALAGAIEVPEGKMEAFLKQLPQIVEFNLEKMAECGLLVR